MASSTTLRARSAATSFALLVATILLLTIGRQVYTQWRDGTSQGVSKWLFVGQLAASTAIR